MNMNFKFALGARVVIPHVGRIGAVESLRVYLDKSKLVLVRWAQDGEIQEAWFTEKELKAPKPEKKKVATKEPAAKKKTTRRSRTIDRSW